MDEVKVGQKWRQAQTLTRPERVVEVVELLPDTNKVRIRHKQTLSLVVDSGFKNGKFTLVKDVA